MKLFFAAMLQRVGIYIRTNVLRIVLLDGIKMQLDGVQSAAADVTLAQGREILVLIVRKTQHKMLHLASASQILSDNQ